MKIAKRILAIEAAPDAIPPKPKIAAMIAITKKVIVQRNITVEFKGDYNYTVLINENNVPYFLKGS